MGLRKIVNFALIGGSVILVARYGCSILSYLRSNLSESERFSYSKLIQLLSKVIWRSNSKKYSLEAVQLHLASTEHECEELMKILKRQVEADCFLGFDCEWVSDKPVALIQLSTKDGFCVIVHLSKIETFPTALQDILEDDMVLKVGVGVMNDAKLLFRDYLVEPRGCVDLRYLAPFKEKMGLAALASDHLNISLDKSSRVRRSNWAADFLSEEQLRYAGQDAFVGALLFQKLIADTLTQVGVGNSLDADDIVTPFIGLNFKGSKNIKGDSGLKPASRQTSKVKDDGVCNSGEENNRKAMRAYTPRKAPIYSNCKMLAPDGEVLCTCSRKKADWYVSQGLAQEVTLEPYVIQLLFEPAQRFRTASGQYYVQDKVNQCVVCGKKDSHLRKTVVPHEYRRHFPDGMKKHQSHDILPLCQLCHLRSNVLDTQLRQRLAVECNALIGEGSDIKSTDDMRLKKLRSAARALLHGKDRISDVRREELRKVVTEELPYYEEKMKTKSSEGGAGDVTTFQNLSLDEILPQLRDIDISVANTNYIPHGLKVTEHFAKVGIPGLMKLEKMWRAHFLETMKPRFLPQLWSVSHFHDNEREFTEDEAFQNKMQKIKDIKKN